MISLGAYIMEEVSAVFMDVQTELVFFMLAIGTHLLFFNKFNFFNKSALAKPKVVDTHSSLKQQQRVAPNAAMQALKAALRAGDVKAAMEHFEALQSLWQGHDSPSSAPHMLLEQLVKVAAQSGALSQLLQLMAKMGLVNKALDLVLVESSSKGDSVAFAEAERLGRAEGVKFTASTYQALVKGASICGAPEDAKRFMKEAQQSGLADVAIYTTYMKGLLKTGNNQEMRKVMEAMRAAGLQPSVVTFNGFLGAAVASGAGAMKIIMDEMKASNIKPDQVTCAILLKTVSANSKGTTLETVLAMLDDLEGEMDEVLFGSVVEACLRVGRADYLAPLLEKKRTAKGFGVKGAHTYGSIIRAYGYVQDIEGAWNAWREMRRQHILPISVTVGCMVEALVTNGDIEAGYELVQELCQDEATAPLVNAVIYGSIVKGFSHKRSFVRVWQVYDEMIAKNLKFSIVTFNTLIDACARSGELNRLPMLLKDIDAQDLKLGIVTYSAILKGYCQANRLDEAFELVESMKKTTDLVPDEIMFNSLLDGCARQGLYDRGMELFAKMESAGVRPSNFTLSVLVKMANRGKRLEQAFKICDEVSSKYKFRLNVHVFANLVQACINHHDLPRAIGVLDRMLQERVRPDLRTYSMLLRACIDAREAVDADGLLRSATGLRGAKFVASAAQVQGGLPGDLISEILQGLMDRCCEERLAASLLVDLGRSVKVDPKLRLRLAARMG